MLDPVSDVVDSAFKVGDAVVRTEGIAGDERQRYRDVVAETFDVLQQVLALPANRLTKLLAIDDQAEFANELSAVADLQGWEVLERKAYLCEPLRACGREMEGMFDKIKGHVAVKDWDRLHLLVEQLLLGEAQFAMMISASLLNLSAMAPDARASTKGHQNARRAVDRERTRYRDLRKRLITKELEFYDTI